MIALVLVLASLPQYLSTPPSLKPQGELSEQQFGEAELAEGETRRGRLWSQDWSLSGVADDATGKQCWDAIAPALKKGGWTIRSATDGLPFGAIAEYHRGGKDAWAKWWLGSRDDIRVTLVEAAPLQTSLKLSPPAAKPEKVSETSGDFPYLPPLPGSQKGDQGSQDKPFLVTLPNQDEPEQVATGSLVKAYQKEGLSNVEFLTVYKGALAKAGWSIVGESNGSDAVLVAHYAKAGRDLWVSLRESLGDYTIDVADVGAIDLAARLAKDCRVELQGVLFDFNKSTLRPESSGVLERAADALKRSPNLALEVQGHTDDVGGEAYNDKLSSARAAAVRDWLVQHGARAGSLTARGYGMKNPIVSNDSPEGRARNRRVELSCRK